MRVARALVVGLAFAAAMILVLSSDLYYRTLPTVNGHYRLLGLEETGEVLRDELGMAHVYARNAHDLYFLQGYATAQDRLAQMDALRVAARARPGDTAQQAVSRAPTALRDALDAYAAGVSKLMAQYTSARALPADLVLAGRDPPVWEPADSLAIASDRLGALLPSSICAAAPAAGTLKGSPILGADLFGDLPDPGWYAIAIDGADVRAAGASLPGVPGIVAGHNGWVAWALLPSIRPQPDPVATVAGLVDGSARVTAGGFLAAMSRSAVAVCVADLQGHEGAMDFGRTAFVPADRPLIIGDEARASRVVAGLSGARDVDVESMRVLLGVPPRVAGARLIVDLAENGTSKLVVSGGLSGQRSSSHYRDQAALWERGAVRTLPFSRSAIARPEGDLVFRPR